MKDAPDFGVTGLQSPFAVDVFRGVAAAFQAQARESFLRLPHKPTIGRVQVSAGPGAAVAWAPGDPAEACASVSNVTLILPAVDPAGRMTRGEANTFAGYSVHELAHVLFTRFSDFATYAKRGAMHKHTLNALEDPRIERRLIGRRLIPGARPLLLQLTQFILDRALAAGSTYLAECRADSLSAMPFTLAIFCREYPLVGLDAVQDALGPKLQAAVALGVAGVRTAQSTVALWPVADACLALWKADADEPKDGGDAGEPGEPGDKGKGAGKGKGKPKGKPEGDEPGDGDADGDEPAEGAGDGEGDADGADGDGEGEDAEGDGEGAGDAQDGAGEGDGDGEGEGDAEGDAQAGDATGGGAGHGEGADEEREAKAAAAIDADGTLNPEPAGAADAIAGAKGDPQAVAAKMTRAMTSATFGRVAAQFRDSDGADFWRRALATFKASPLARAKLVRALRSPRLAWAAKKLLAGRLDHKRLTRSALNDPAIFAKRGEVPATATAVTLLIDGSGSMGGSPEVAAAQAAYALAKLFEGMRLPCEIARFKDGVNADVHLGVAKDRDQPLWKATGALLTIAGNAEGGTPDKDAVDAYIARMARWTEARRILIVLTDGVGYGSAEEMRQIVARGEAAGVQVCAIGINVNETALRARYPRAVVVKRHDEIAGALADTLLKAADEWERGQATRRT